MAAKQPAWIYGYSSVSLLLLFFGQCVEQRCPGEQEKKLSMIRTRAHTHTNFGTETRATAPRPQKDEIVKLESVI